MRWQETTRRRFLGVASAVGVTGLAGCPGDGGGDDEETPTSPATTGSNGQPTTSVSVSTTEPQTSRSTTVEETAQGTTTGGESVEVTGRLVTSGGDPISEGSVVAIGGTDGGVEAEPDQNGRYTLDLESRVLYTLAYGQSPAGRPAVFVIDRLSAESSLDIGETTVPDSYEVEISVESDGSDVTDGSDITVTHVRNGNEVRIQPQSNPVELTGTVVVEATYEGATASEEITVDSDRTVTVTV